MSLTDNGTIDLSRLLESTLSEKDLDMIAYGLDERRICPNSSMYDIAFIPATFSHKLEDEIVSNIMFNWLTDIKPELYRSKEAQESFIESLPIENGAKLEYEVRKRYKVPLNMSELMLNYTMTNIFINNTLCFEEMFDVDRKTGLWINIDSLDDTFILLDDTLSKTLRHKQYVPSLMYAFIGKGKFKNITVYRVLHDVILGVEKDPETDTTSICPITCRRISDFTKKINIKEINDEFELRRYGKPEDSCNG